MMAEIKSQLGVQIDVSPEVERGPVTQAGGGGKGRIILVGASHMARV
jgi:hypothetical protein